MGKRGLAGTPAAVARSRIAVCTLGILALALAVAAVPLDVLSRQESPAEPLIAAASFTAVGLVVARRRQRNPIGWLLAAIGILVLLTVAGGYYAVLVCRLRYRLPLGPLALVFDVFWEPAILALPLVILLFPDGRLPSRRWRWTLEAYLGLAAGYAIAAQLKDAMDPDAVRVDLLDAVHRALEPTRASVWASQHEPQKKGR
jgi:two-component system, NarL family, sensor kinase